MANNVYTQIKDLPSNDTPSLTDELPTQSASGGVGSTKKVSIQKIKDIAVSDALLKANNLSDLSNVTTAKTNLSLENVDNTSDLDKPLSTATQNALNIVTSNILSVTLKEASNLSDVNDKDQSALNIGLGAGVKEQLNIATDLTLTNPSPNKLYLSFSATGRSVIFPVFNESQSITNVGVGYIFISNVGTNSFTVKKNDGTALQEINQGQSFYFSPFDNLSGNPDFHVIDASVIIDTSNMPTADEKAALSGTSGSPSSTNKYVTNEDPRLTGNVIPLSQTLYISKAGNDTNANGTYENPYATYSKAITAITDNSISKIYNIVFTAGSYTETSSIVLKPYINLVGESSGSVFLSAPSITIDNSFGTVTTQEKNIRIEFLNFNFGVVFNFDKFTTAGSYGAINCTINNCFFNFSVIANSNVIPLNLYVTNSLTASTADFYVNNAYVYVNNCYFNNFFSFPDGTNSYVDSTADISNTFIKYYKAQSNSSNSKIINFNCSRYVDFVLQGTSNLVLNIDSVSYRNTIIPQDGSILNLITKSEYINADYTPSHYTASTVDLKSHLQGIDTALQAAGNVNADWDATSGAAQILHKPTLDTNNTPNTVVFRDSSGNFSSNYPYFNSLNIGVTAQQSSGTLVVGGLNPVEQLSVDSAPSWSPIQLGSGSMTYWQSFTEITGGYLTRIDFYFDTSGFTSGSYDLNIYLGNGIGGTLLHTETKSLSISGVYSWILNTQTLLMSTNTRYTVQIKSNPFVTPVGGILYTTASYSGGQSNLSPTWNYRVQVYKKILTNYVKVGTDSLMSISSDLTIAQNAVSTITASSKALSFNPDSYLINNATNGTYTLPTPVSSRFIYLKKISPSSVTCTISYPSGTIDGSQTAVLTNQYSALLLKNDGANYFIF